MSITMRLDAPAVRDLIKANDEFRLELQSAVTQEIVRGLYEKSIPQQVLDAINNQFAQHKQDLTQAVAVNESLKTAFDKALTGIVATTRSSANNYATTRQLSPEAKSMVDARVYQLIKEVIDEKTEGFNARIDAAIERMERRAENMMEARLKAFDKAYHDLALQKVMEKFVSFSTN